MERDGKSIRWIVIWTMLFMAFLAWGFMAGSCAGNTHAVHIASRRGSAIWTFFIFGVYSFLATSIYELPNFFSVISWHFSNRIWLPLLFIVLEVAIALSGVGLQKLEDNLSTSDRHRRR